MPPASNFSPAFQSNFHGNNCPLHLRPQSEKKRKRKSETWETAGSIEQPRAGSTASLVTSSSRPSSHDPLDQYYVAGAGSEVGEVLGCNYPHASPCQTSDAVSSNTRKRIHEELESLRPPLCSSCILEHNETSPESYYGKAGLRQRHLASVTAVMHRCLLESDYLGAGRAWGMILRAGQSGHSMDLRTSGRWGVGAEILLQREKQLEEIRAGSENSSRDQRSQAPPSMKRFSAQGFKAAKDYYEWLILQYPYRKVSPLATGSLDFYNAMFNLWIYSVAEMHSQALRALLEAKPDTDFTHEDASDIREGMCISESEILNGDDQEREVIRRDTFQHVLAIAKRLDELLGSPPYSDEAIFWKIKGMVASWMADLVKPRYGPSPDSENEESSTHNSTNLDTILESDQIHGRTQDGLSEQEIYAAEARVAFDKVVTCGKHRTV